MVAMASTMVSGVKYAGANIAGFDFGCGTDVNHLMCSDYRSLHMMLTEHTREHALSPV